MTERIKNILERLSLPVNYIGGHYCATSTEYRGGDNPRGVLAYEKNVYDQIAQKSYLWPEFVAVVKHITREDAEKWLAGCEIEDGNVEERRQEKIQLPEKLREEDYANLVKSYDFFLKRGILKETLDTYGAGLAQSGPMYGRITFPVRSEGVLRGASGRDALGRSHVPKWKHKGKKGDFVYPMFEPDVFQKTKQVVLVESIGDSLSLWNAGIKQNLVQFGLSLSPKLLSFIISQNPEQIFVSLNNDKEQEINRGQEAAAKVATKLQTFFDSKKIKITPPFHNDFGEQSREQNLKWAEKYGVSTEVS